MEHSLDVRRLQPTVILKITVVARKLKQELLIMKIDIDVDCTIMARDIYNKELEMRSYN